jgi:hypothetical protein
MTADFRQQEELEQELEIRDALARVTLGLTGRTEAQILATALGPRFSDDNARKEAV